MGTGVGTRGLIQDGNGDGNEDGVGESGKKVKKRKKSHKRCRRYVGHRGDLGGRRKNVDKK